MSWLKKLFGINSGQVERTPQSTSTPSSRPQQPVPSEASVVAYNEGVAAFGKRDFQKGEELFLRAMNETKSQTFRRVAVAAAGMCRLRRGTPLTAEMFPADLRDDKNGCLVAFLAVNMAAQQIQQGRTARTRADGSTWYVDTEISGCKYELRVINFGGNTMGQAFRQDASGKLLYLAELEQDPSKSHLRKPSDSSLLSFLRKNIKAESTDMASLPADGLSSIVGDDKSTLSPPDLKVKVISYR